MFDLLHNKIFCELVLLTYHNSVLFNEASDSLDLLSVVLYIFNFCHVPSLTTTHKTWMQRWNNTKHLHRNDTNMLYEPRASPASALVLVKNKTKQ